MRAVAEHSPLIRDAGPFVGRSVNYFNIETLHARRNDKHTVAPACLIQLTILAPRIPDPKDTAI